MGSTIIPLHVFRFQVDFYSDSLDDGDDHEVIEVCSGAFAIAPVWKPPWSRRPSRKAAAITAIPQRAGAITFATVVLKRGISTNRNLWQIFNSFASGMFAPRLQVMISLLDGNGNPVMGWQLDRAMPVKFKFADLNAKGTEVGIEELHLVHEGLSST